MQDRPLVAEIGRTDPKAPPGGWDGQICLGAPVMFDYEGLGRFRHLKVRLVKWVMVRSATKPHERQALLYGRVKFR